MPTARESSNQSGGLLGLADTWPSVSALLDEVLALDDAERRAWLEKLTQSGSPSAAILKQILGTEASVESGDFLKRPAEFAKILDAQLVSGEGAPIAVDKPQDNIGPYRLVRELGRGGMGVVWLAERSDGSFARQVALKVLTHSSGRSDLALRFARERDILARLEHPNIARLYDAGVSELGQPFLVLQYVEGVPITAYCAAHKLTTHERVRLFSRIIPAVQYAHERLILHRDIKPSNVLVTPAGEVCLLDFGIAKFLDADSQSAPETELTAIHGKALTLHYASPEQIRGEPLTLASDTYSLGVLLYELLTDARPHQAARPSAASLEEAILNGDAIPPSDAVRGARASEVAACRTTTPRALETELRGDLDAILLTAIASPVKRRYASLALFGADLDAWARGLPVAARPESMASRTRRFVARYRTLVLGSSVVAVALVGLTVAAFWQANRANENYVLAAAESARAQTLAARADTEAERARQASQSALSEAGRANSLAHAERESSQQARNAETEARRQAALAERERQIAAENAQKATAAELEARRQADIALRDRQVARNEAEKANVTLQFLKRLLNKNTLFQDDPRKAQQTTVRELLDDGATQLLAESSLKPETHLELIALLLQLHSELKLNAREVELSRKRVELSRKATGTDANRLLLIALISHAASLRNVSSTDEVDRIVAEATAMMDGTAGVNDSLRMSFHLNVANTYSSRNVGLAENHAVQAYELFRKDPAFAAAGRMNALGTLAGIYTSTGRHTLALPLLTEWVEKLRLIPNGEARLPQPLLHRANGLENLSRWSEAERDYLEAVEITRKHFGDKSPESYHVPLGYAGYLGRIGKRDAEVAILEPLLAKAAAALEENHLTVLALRRSTSAAYRAVGDYTRAESVLAPVQDLLAKTSTNSAYNMLLLRESAALRDEIGDEAAANDLFERVKKMSLAIYREVHPATAQVLARRAIARKDIAGAKEVMASIAARTLKSKLPEDPENLVLRAELLLAEGRYAEAHAMMIPALKIWEEAEPQRVERPLRYRARVVIGEAACELKEDHAGGARLLAEAIDGYRGAGMKLNPDMIRLHMLLANCSRKLGMNRDAAEQEAAARAVAQHHKKLAPRFTALLPAAR